ncbi:MAG: ATP-binding protein [Defluviitaleaceae bacterium]|nr:ATP-binding protein [Defluviitaleaceae bacterium]
MLEIKDYNKGLIYTDVKGCIDCNKCIHECPVLRSNVSVPFEGKYKISVDDNECILCGTCMVTCVHDARKFRDDTEEFFSGLASGKSISVLIAPSFFLNYPDYKKILGHLKNLGVKNFYPVSIGIDIAMWGYLRCLQGDKKGYISQPCPSIVRHIEKHQPYLIQDLMPIHSPMMCTAIYLKKYKNVTDDLVFLGPCIAKKMEIQRPANAGNIKYSVTFRGMMEHLKRDDIANAVELDDEFVTSASFSGPGGLKEHLEYYMGNEAVIMQVEGERRAYEFLSSFEADKKADNKHMPMLIDVLNCKYGCCQGTGTEIHEVFRTDIAYNALHARRKKHENAPQTPKERRDALDKHLSHLNIDDFKCIYEEDKSPKTIIPQAKIENIFREKLLKLSDDAQHVDCAACGYKTCRDMAEAISLGINHHDNCVYYIKNNLSLALKEKTSSEREMRNLINIMPIVTTITNNTVEVVECNKEALRLFESADIDEYKTKYFTFWPETQPDGSNSREKARRHRQNTIEKGYTHFEWTYQKKCGEIIPCEVVLMRFNWMDEIHIVSFIKDMREQHKLEETMAKLKEANKREKRANKAKTRFLARMSHEIRTPMNSVMGITELQLRKDSHPPETEEAFSRIYNSSSLLLSIINDILDLSKVEAGKIEITPAEYEVASMIVDTVQLNLMYVGSKQIEFSLHVNKEMPTHLIGDEIRIKQILNNFLSNAFKYTPAGSVTLSFDVEKISNDEVIVIVSVSDTGQGMSAEQVDNLFDGEFTRFNVESNREIEGSGLGLNIAHQLTRMMNGTIEVESKPGKGTTFTVRLPQKIKNSDVLGSEVALGLQNFEDTQKSIKRLSKFERESMPYGRVLVVDDVESNLYVAKGFLMPYKLTVDTAESAYVALEKINNGNVYDIIFMDHMMPGMDGIEATKKLRKKGYKHPIIALTANAFSDMAEVFLQSGFDSYATKPIDINRLDGYLMKYIREKQPPEVIEKANRAKQASKEWREKALQAIRELRKEKPNDNKDMEFLREQMTIISDACDFFEVEEAKEALVELQKRTYSPVLTEIIDKISKLLKNGYLKETSELAQQALKL